MAPTPSSSTATYELFNARLSPRQDAFIGETKVEKRLLSEVKTKSLSGAKKKSLPRSNQVSASATNKSAPLVGPTEMTQKKKNSERTRTDASNIKNSSNERQRRILAYDNPIIHRDLTTDENREQPNTSQNSKKFEPFSRPSFTFRTVGGPETHTINKTIDSLVGRRKRLTEEEKLRILEQIKRQESNMRSKPISDGIDESCL